MSIMESMDIGVKSLTVHGKRIDLHAKNIANLDTPNYVRKIPVLNSTDDLSFHGLMNAMKEDVFGGNAHGRGWNGRLDVREGAAPYPQNKCRTRAAPKP